MDRASEQIKIGVGWLDLNKIHAAQLDIRACRSGQYELSDGARLDIECSLDVNISAYRTDTPPPGRSQQRERSNAKSLSEPRT